MWDLRSTNSRELSKVLSTTGGPTGGPPGSRSRNLGIKRGMHMVGFVRWGRNHPMNQRKLVRWSRIALWDEMWVFELAT
jgi:hypothetical protein